MEATAEILDTFTYAGLGGRMSGKKAWIKITASTVADSARTADPATNRSQEVLGASTRVFDTGFSGG